MLGGGGRVTGEKESLNLDRGRVGERHYRRFIGV